MPAAARRACRRRAENGSGGGGGRVSSAVCARAQLSYGGRGARAWHLTRVTALGLVDVVVDVDTAAAAAPYALRAGRTRRHAVCLLCCAVPSSPRYCRVSSESSAFVRVCECVCVCCAVCSRTRVRLPRKSPVCAAFSDYPLTCIGLYSTVANVCVCVCECVDFVFGFFAPTNYFVLNSRRFNAREKKI